MLRGASENLFRNRFVQFNVAICSCSFNENAQWMTFVLVFRFECFVSLDRWIVAIWAFGTFQKFAERADLFFVFAGISKNLLEFPMRIFLLGLLNWNSYLAFEVLTFTFQARSLVHLFVSRREGNGRTMMTRIAPNKMESSGSDFKPQNGFGTDFPNRRLRITINIKSK